MLLVLLLGIVDFGRVFNAGITLEAVARDAAEVGALQRLRDKPDFADPSLHPAYYTALHQLIARTACAESEQLALSPEQVSAVDCPRLTAVRACVHDSLDTECGSPIPGFDGPVPGGVQGHCGRHGSALVELLRWRDEQPLGGGSRLLPLHDARQLAPLAAHEHRTEPR